MKGPDFLPVLRRGLSMFAIAMASMVLLTTAQTVPAAAQQTCIWEGRAPACNGKCRPGYTLIQRRNKPRGRTDTGFGRKCVTGKKALCCKTSDIIIRGTAPFCNGRCKPGEERLGDSKKGPNGKKCRTGKAAICRIKVG